MTPFNSRLTSAVFAAAGLAGLACGKILQVSQDHPSTARTLFTCSAISSVAGATLGVGVAYYRGAPLHVYGVSAGVNFALCSFAFCGERYVVVYESLLREIELSCQMKGSWMIERGRMSRSVGQWREA